MQESVSLDMRHLWFVFFITSLLHDVCLVCSLVISAVTYWNKTWDRMIDDILRVKMTITPENHELLDFWADPPMHSTFDIYLWNVTNSHAVLVRNST